MNHLKTLSFLTVFSALMLSGCGSMGNGSSGSGFNLFPVEQDIKLGKQVSAEIESKPGEYPILDQNQYSEVYAYINKMKTTILNSGKVKYKNEFAWDIKVIHDDETLNAFCTPGGYIYIYTGLIKFLDSEDQLAGVLGHEMGHADLRHSTRQMTKMYGVDMLTSAVLGEQEALKQITTALIGLKFSRSHETEADNASVTYLCSTPYNAAGAAGFFEKISAEGGGGSLEFLSTHPNPDNRVENINSKKSELSCTGNNTYESEYNRIKNTLP